MTTIALQKDKVLLVGAVVVKPSWADDRVRQPARPQEPLAASLPVVALVGALIVACSKGHPDRRHQSDSHPSRAERGDSVADRAVVDALRCLGVLVRSVSEHDCVDVGDGVPQRLGSRQVADDALRLKR